MELIDENIDELRDKETGAIPIFKLVKIISMHDPNWNRGKPVNPLKLEEKPTAQYRDELFPPETE